MWIQKKIRQRQFLTKVIQVVCTLGLIFLLGSCSNSTGSDPEPEIVEFRLSTAASPTEGGEVSPSTGMIDQGTNVSLEATPNTGWAFDGWTGSIESQENPLDVQVSSDLDLTGNFRRTESIYRVSLSLSDDSGTLDALGFGQLQDPSSEGVPDAPPPPPSGVLSGWFDRGGERLYMDYRESLDLSASWQLHVELGSGEQLDLSWQIDSELLEGSLHLFGPDGSELANMLQDSTAQITLPGGEGVLSFEYKLE